MPSKSTVTARTELPVSITIDRSRRRLSAATARAPPVAVAPTQRDEQDPQDARAAGHPVKRGLPTTTAAATTGAARR